MRREALGLLRECETLLGELMHPGGGRKKATTLHPELGRALDRLVSFISRNWRGKPLLTHATIVNLIARTATATGLKVRCLLDAGKYYPAKQDVSAEQMASIRVTPDTFHGDWNYTIHPRRH